MARKKKEQAVVVETPAPKKGRKKKPDYERDDGPLTEKQLAQLPVREIIQFEIDWEKIAADVKEAALMVETAESVEVEKPKRKKVKNQT